MIQTIANILGGLCVLYIMCLWLAIIDSVETPTITYKRAHIRFLLAQSYCYLGGALAINLISKQTPMEDGEPQHLYKEVKVKCDENLTEEE